MSELRSKCCGAKVKFSKWGTTLNGKNVYYSGYICLECHKPCEVEEKEEESK